jgi:transcriptional regulator with XRE-family HTH domain
MSISSKIRERRMALGLSQEQLARRADISLNTWAKLETGFTTDPHYSTLSQVAHALGITVAELAGEEPVPKASARPESGQEVAPEAMPEPSGHAHQVGIHEGEKGTEVTYTRRSFLELYREIREGEISEEDAWQRFQAGAS